MLNMGIQEVERLSQDEGMYDKEIALIMGIHRTTVTRIRLSNNIPRAKLSNRKDKVVHCTKCKKPFIIRRKERAWRCQDCAAIS